MEEKNGLTLKQLVKVTGAKPYTIHYLNSCGKLKLVNDVSRSGRKNFYSQESVKIILNHINN